MNAKLIGTLAKKEFLSYFKNPMGYVFLVIFLFGASYLCFEPGRGSFFALRTSSMSPYFEYLPWMFLFLIPAVSMRLWSEERRSGSIELLLSMPISIGEAVVAKFLASWLFLGVAILASFPMFLTVVYLGSPDYGQIFSGYLASFLLAGSMLAMGSFFSALSKNAVISFIACSVCCFVFMMAGSPPVLDFLSVILPDFFLSVFESLSLLNHFEQMEKGLISLGSLWFFALLMAFWLMASVYLLEENKAN